MIDALRSAPFDAFLAASVANLDYGTGYRSMSGAVFGTMGVGAFITPERSVMAGPVADAAPALESGIAEDDYVPYGTFFFESTQGHAASRMSGERSSFVQSLTAAAGRAGLSHATIGIDEAALGPALAGQLSRELPEAKFVDASSWALQVRARKLPEEIHLLERAARLAEDGVAAAIEAATVGISERELANVVARTMADGGGMPRFVVVASGPRSALADTFATDRTLLPGDLVRFDVGCLVDGYWSDIGRTAVVGEPDASQTKRYNAIFEGEDQQLARIRPGIPARDVFAIAIDAVERKGIVPYRRHHCGHGIGLDVYEPPIVNPATETPLEAGMTFCLETPYYELGWGGMMVEDTIVVTDDGHTRFTVTDRGLRVIPA
jgi:Xaa-Pro aminopeptidase